MLSDKALAERDEKRSRELFRDICSEVEKRHPSLCQRDVADTYGVAYRTWQRWVNGKGSPKKPQAVAFADAIRVRHERVLDACARTRAWLRGTPVAEPASVPVDTFTPLYTPEPEKLPPADDSGGNWPGRRF